MRLGHALPHGYEGFASEAACSRLCSQTGTLHSCVNVERLRTHFNFARLYTCLYSTGVERALRAMFQVKGRTPLMMMIGRDAGHAGYAGSVVSEKFPYIQRSGATYQYRWLRMK